MGPATSKTGVSVEALSELKYAAEMAGGSLQTIQNGLKFVARTGYDAATGGKETAEAYKAIGSQYWTPTAS